MGEIKKNCNVKLRKKLHKLLFAQSNITDDLPFRVLLCFVDIEWCQDDIVPWSVTC